MLPPSMLPLSLESVVRLVFRGENAGRELGNEPYITYSCKRLEKAKDNGARIVNNQPPRHMKSTAGTVGLSVWLLGLNPAEKILIVTYSAQLVADLGYRIREALRSNWFRLLYPQTRLTSDRTSVNDFATTAGGGVYLASVDGSFIGRGATVIIFDDPLDMDDAGNPEKRHKVNERFDTAILSRLNDPINGRVVINAHRLHEDPICRATSLAAADGTTLSFHSRRLVIEFTNSRGGSGTEKRATCCVRMRFRAPKSPELN